MEARYHTKSSLPTRKLLTLSSSGANNDLVIAFRDGPATAGNFVANGETVMITPKNCHGGTIDRAGAGPQSSVGAIDWLVKLAALAGAFFVLGWVGGAYIKGAW